MVSWNATIGCYNAVVAAEGCEIVEQTFTVAAIVQIGETKTTINVLEFLRAVALITDTDSGSDKVLSLVGVGEC